MPRYEQMPNGQTVAVPDDVSPDALNRIRAKYPAKATKNTITQDSEVNTPRTPAQTRVDKRKAGIKRQNKFKLTDVAEGLIPHRTLVVADRLTGGNLGAGALFNFDDEIKGATSALEAIPEAVRKGSFKPISQKYREDQQAFDGVKEDFARDNPGTALAAQLAGGLLVPFGGTGKTAFTAAKGLRAVGATKAAKTVGRVAARQRKSGAIAKGITTGAGVGALNAAGSSKDLSSIPGDAAAGALVGGAFGGTLGAAVRGGSAAVRTIKDRRTVAQGGSEATKARAYSRVGSLIDNIRGKDDKPIGAEAVAKNVRSARRTGSDTRLLDQSPGLRAEAATLGRSISLPNSNRLQELADTRINERRGRFGEQTSKRATTGGVDVRGVREGIKSARKLQGDRDYARGGSMDTTQIPLNDDLRAFYDESPDLNRLIRKAYTTAQRFGDDIGRVEKTEHGLEVIPSARVMDYVKREFDGEIGEAKRKGNDTLAAGLSAQLENLKFLISEANPEYGKILATQRDAFQREQASKLGEEVVGMLANKPREAYRLISQSDPKIKDDLRIGIIDRILNFDTKADPISAFDNIMRNKAQRKILEFAFGGKKEVSSFEKYVKNEIQALRTDNMVLAGRNSVTSVIDKASAAQGGELSEIARKTGQGIGFGGALGGVANFANATQAVANRVNPEVQNEIARILMSKGDDLEEGLAMAAKFFARRIAKDRKTTAVTARGVATPLGAEFGE